MQESKQEITKLSPMLLMAENLPSISSSLKQYVVHGRLLQVAVTLFRLFTIT